MSNPYSRWSPPIVVEDELVRQDLARHLHDLEVWGEEQRRDALRHLMDALPERLRIEVANALVGKPDYSLVDKDT